MACVDKSDYAAHVADYAAWAAARLSAPIELLHVIDRHPEIAADVDRSGSIGVDAQENLLERLSQEEGERSKVIREQGRVFLNQLRTRCETHTGLQTDTRQRYGQLLATLKEQESSVAMYVLGRRGESASHTRRDLGRHVEAICRQIRRPIMTVTDDFKAPKSVLVAYDGGRMTRRGIELSIESQHAGPAHSRVMSGKRGADSARHIEWAEQTLKSANFSVDASFIPGDPEQVVTRAIAERRLIFDHGGLQSLTLAKFVSGSRTNDLLRASQVPTITLHL